MAAILFVFEADVFHQFDSRLQPEHAALLPGLRIGFGIVDCYFVRHCGGTGSPESFGQVKLIAVRMTIGIEGGFVVHVCDIDDQGVAVPLPDRGPEPGWILTD